jgi:hypothetical protein
MITLADDYVDAHNLYEKKDSGKHDKKKFFKSTDYKKDDKSSEVKNSHRSENTHDTHSKTDNASAGSENKRKPLICYNCNKPGHKASECRSKTGSSNNSNGWKPSQRTAACHIYNSVEADKSSENNDCEVKTTRKWPTVAITGQDDVEFIKDFKYPYRGKAKLNGHSVVYIRDTGSSICIAKESKIELSQYTGETTSVLLADRTVRHLPNALVSVKIPGYEGLLKVCTMEDPVCDLIIGNDWNERPVERLEEEDQ